MNEKLKKLSQELQKLNFKNESKLVIKLGEQNITDKEIVIATLLGEASVDGSPGMIAIYSVIKNRAQHKNTSMKNICLEPKQFSMWNDKRSLSQQAQFINKLKTSPGGLWKEAERIVNSNPNDTTFGSTHYFTGPTPFWASNKNPCWIPRVRVGSHIFGIDLSVDWINALKLPGDIRKEYLREGREPARCYVDIPKRHPPKSLKGR